MSEKNNKKKSDDISLPKKILMILGSLFIALVLWYVGTSQDHTLISKHLTDIPVVYRGELTLSQNGFLMNKTDGICVDVVLRGYSSDLFSLNSGNLVAVIDVSTYDKTQKYNVEPVIEGISDKVSVSRIDSVEFSIERLIKKQLPIDIEFIGSPRRNYKIDETGIQVIGAVGIACGEDLSQRITGARITVDVDGKTEAFSVDAELVLVDIDGNEVSSDNVILEFDTVNIMVPIREAE